MIKKGIGAIFAATLISAGFSQGAVFAASVSQAQTYTASAGQVEKAITSNPMALFQSQKVDKKANQLQVGTPTAAGQGQAVSIACAQVQSAVTSEPATFAQAAGMKLNMLESQRMDPSGQMQSIHADNNLTQSITASHPSLIIQAQSGMTASIQFQASIPGGPTVQNQITYRHASQYQAAMSLRGKLNR